MKKKQVLSLTYLVMALAYAISGVLMVLAPTLWLRVFPIAAPAPVVLYFIQMMGIADLAAAPLFIWCARNLKKRKPVHFALTLYVLGLALVNAVQWVTAPVSLSLPFWVDISVAYFLPAVLMLIMALPPLPTRIKGPRERGSVKWFNATKGFGFVTREQGDDVFVHYRSIRGEGHRTLREGQRVEFVVVKGDKGLQAEDVQPL